MSEREQFISRRGLRPYLKSCDAWSQLYGVASAVRDLHLEGIPHCDLKPANIFLGRDGRAHLSFEHLNLAAKFAKHGLSPPLNGSSRWQSPEVLNGEEPTSMSDVYAPGMCAIYIVSGNPPWGEASSEEDVKRQVCHATPLRREGAFTDDEWHVIVRMCDLHPGNRLGLDAVIPWLVNIVSFQQAPGWQLSDGDFVVQDDAPFSQTQYLSRHVGRWKDAIVAVETVTERFTREDKSFGDVADLWFSLQHPTILQLFGACCDGCQEPAFVCEYAECGDLRSYLFRKNFTAAWSQIWQILLDVALGIRYLHAIGVSHGDIGLHNILVMRSGRGKLAGFSLSAQIGQQYPDTSATEHKTETAAASGTEEAGFASDVYWFGRSIVDAFCGSQSVNANTTQAGAHEPRDMQRPELLSEEEWALVMAMCCAVPVDRIEMPEVAKRLARLSAVNIASDAELSKTEKLLSVNQRHTLQAMVLEEVLKYEKEDEEHDAKQEADRHDVDDTLDDDFYDPRAGMQRKDIVHQNTLSTLATYAARAILTPNLHSQLRNYRPRPSLKGTPARSRIHFVPPHQGIPRWRLSHASVLEAKAVAGLGGGSYALVASGIWLGASVALKKMKEVDLDHDQTLRQEANLWFRLRHPHIVSLFGVCCGGYQLFVCDLVGGGRLDKY
jgi:serine/threonine protein kinase